MTSWTFSWTPGPWWWEVTVLESERREVLTTRSRLAMGTGEDIANTHLIAAAPDLYEALERILRMPVNGVPLRDWEDYSVKEALGALAKARGEA